MTPSVELPVPPGLNKTLVLPREAASADGNERLRETLPEKLLRLVKVTDELPKDPTRIVREDGAAVIWKSAT